MFCIMVFVVQRVNMLICYLYIGNAVQSVTKIFSFDALWCKINGVGGDALLKSYILKPVYDTTIGILSL